MLYFHSPPSDDNCSEETGGGARVARAVARREVLSQLQQLECQLTAIETTARTVEGELLASNQVKVEGVVRVRGSHAGGIMLWVAQDYCREKTHVRTRIYLYMYMYNYASVYVCMYMSMKWPM